MNLLLSLFAVLSVTVAAPAPNPTLDERSLIPTVVAPSPSATYVGLGGAVEIFQGVPFAQTPTGSLRLSPPQPIQTDLGTVNAILNGPACPQFFFSDEDYSVIPDEALGYLLDTPLFQVATDQSEDCLYLNIYRPEGTTSDSKLPILFWIFGGGFELGYTSMYPGEGWVEQSVLNGQPMIFISVAYRVGGFGFMPGSEILANGSSNLGLLDQRLGLQWVADNIESFGGDPDKVTIWGESAGAISVLDQMILYDGDNTYNGKALFRAGIMNSGSIVPADPVDCPKGQVVYDTVVSNAGCAGASDTLNCLREADYLTLLNAMNSVPGILGYNSIALSYLPRPDGTILTASPDVLVEAGKFAPVPFIIGDQEDEGTLFGLFQPNITTKDDMYNYLTSIFFAHATTEQITALADTYPTISDGSPFRTGILNDWYPQFKLLSAILGDLTFTLSRRSFLNTVNSLYPDLPSWSYLSSYDYGTPIMGTFHASDILQVFFGLLPNYASGAFHAYYISFVNNLDPNDGTGAIYEEWPQWSTNNSLVNMYPTYSTLITDDFRNDTYAYMMENFDIFYI